MSTSQRPTASEAAAVIKRVRSLMRVDKGLSGELDRLPMLTWILLLKLIDDTGTPDVEAPYRWSDWAMTDALSDEERLEFVASEEARRPDGTRGPGLFSYLRSLPGQSADARLVRECFADVTCKLRSGSVLTRIAEQIDRLSLKPDDADTHALGDVYEMLLQEMRDAAGDSGEFYTPRSLTRTMVELLAPRPGETVLDPACGTGGFLVDVAAFLDDWSEPGAAADHGKLLRGWEAKSLPHLLARMNLLLHGRPEAGIELRNSLEVGVPAGALAGYADVILTNPPFGGREEKSVAQQFPEGRRTSETALLFLQLIVELLKPGGRAAVVLPNGSLFAGGAAARVRESLMAECRLDAILRVPEGAFAPYTPIATNVLFFEKGMPSKDVWFYEPEIPDGRSQFTKTNPLEYEHLADFRSWFATRADNRLAWSVPLGDIQKDDYNLDVRNPRVSGMIHDDPMTVLADLSELTRELTERLDRAEQVLGGAR